MKHVYLILAAIVISATAIAQGTPRDRDALKNDLEREREKRHEVAHDVLTGRAGRARADHRAAVAYHNRVHNDLHAMHRHDVQRARYDQPRRHYHPRRHYYRRHYHHPRPPRPHRVDVIVH